MPPSGRFKVCLRAAVLLGIASTAALGAEVAVVTVQGKAAALVFAGDEVRAALRHAGWTFGEDAARAGLSVVLAEPDGRGEPEAFDIAISRTGSTSTVRIRGTDVRGVMYGGLDIAEQVALGRKPAAIEDQKGAPYLPVRALKLNIPLAGNAYLSAEDQANSGWFYDLDYWREFMRFLAYHRYNLLTFWNSHPYDQMVRLAKYPEANGLSPAELDRNIAFFHALFGMARDHGLDTSVVTWNIHCSKTFQEAHGVKDGQDSELIRDYQKECVKALLTEYPELTGLGTCPGENMGGSAEWRENWINATYFAGIRESGRTNLPFIHRYWGTSPEPAAKMLAESGYPGPVLLDIKFNGEHMYSSTAMHPEERGWLTQTPKPYKLLWHLRNDCIFQLRWGDPDFAAAVVRNCGGPDAAGFVMGSEIEVPGVDRNHTPQTAGHKTWKYEFERNWTRFGMWGRAGYNPAEPHAYWIARFGQHLGPQAAPAAFAALQSASKIIPLTSSFHWNYMNGDWYPEGNIGSWNTSAGIPFKNYRDGRIFHDIREWVFTHTIDDSLQCIPYYVADQISGVPAPADMLTPLRVADQLEAAAAACQQQRLAAAGSVSIGKGEWECTEMDLRVLEALGRYYAAKARGATELMFLLATGDELRRAAAIKHLEKALAYWQELAPIADGHYATHEVWLCGKFDWTRYTGDAERDIRTAREMAPWLRDEQSWTLGPANTVATTRSWSADRKAYPGLDAWVEAFNARTGGQPIGDLAAGKGFDDATTVLDAVEGGTAILALGSATIATARINGSDCRLVGAAPDQFLVGLVRSGENRLELGPAAGAAVLPFVTRLAVLAQDSQFIEAESGQVTGPMAIKEIGGVSGGRGVWAPLGKGRGEGAGGKIVDNGWVSFPITIPSDGEYEVHACVWWGDTSANSFHYAWDQATPKLLGNDELYRRWHWVQTGPERLTAGAHTLTIRNRDEGSTFDCLLVSRTEPRPAPAMLDRYFERLSAPHHLRFTTLADWQGRRAELRRLVARDLGLDPLPERLPLEITYGGELDRGEYVVKRVYWQTWPAVYASGYLYLPKTPGKHPAILNPHGHWPNGARDPVVQSRCIGLARKGYVNLAIDSVHMPLAGCLLGVSSLTVMVFNAIRAVDLLESLPEVDASRIGCTGASGGGQQTMFMMGIDDRIAAAVPVAMVTYYRRIMDPAGFPHCTCNIVPGIVRDVDEPEMTATYAPKPTLYECVTGDWTRDFPKEEFPELRSIHALYGAGSDVDVQQWDCGHDYSKPMRERMYAFFNHYLRNVDDPAQAVEPAVEVETVAALVALDKPPADAEPVESVIDWYRGKYAFQPVDAQDASGWTRYQQDLRGRLGELVGDLPVRGRLAEPAQAVDILGHRGSRLLVQSEPDIEVPVVLVSPDAAGPAALVILIHDNGMKGVLDGYQPLVKSLLAGKVAVAVAEVRLTGTLRRNWSLDCILWGRPEVGMAVTDLRACLDVLAQQSGVDGSRIILVGLGGSGISAVFAGALEPRLSAVAVAETGPTYLLGRQTPLIANLLRVADVPQLLATVAPRSVLVGGVAADAYRFAGKVYRGLNVESRLEMRSEVLGANDISAWVLHQVRE